MSNWILKLLILRCLASVLEVCMAMIFCQQNFDETVSYLEYEHFRIRDTSLIQN